MPRGIWTRDTSRSLENPDRLEEFRRIWNDFPASSSMNQRPTRLSSRRIYELTIRIKDIDPPIWRRLFVASDTPLTRLHRIFQLTMGWDDAHLHGFHIDRNTTYGPRDPDFDDLTINERGHKLRDIASEVGSEFCYEYDFGDGWEHHVRVENIFDETELEGLLIRVPYCVEGERACPPEDCGGPYGYKTFLEAVENPAHWRHDEQVEWYRRWHSGELFDSEEFCEIRVNAFLKLLRR